LYELVFLSFLIAQIKKIVRLFCIFVPLLFQSQFKFSKTHLSEFVHLHNHSHFSLLDGAATIEGLVGAAVENKMSAVALTDHGVMDGCIEFYMEAKKAGIKPIIGSEFYIAPHGTSRFDKTARVEGKTKSQGDAFGKTGRGVYNHLVLLAKNELGYKNLIKLSSLAHTEGFYYKPRIDFEVLKQYYEGIVCLSACPVGVIADYLVMGNYEKAKMICREYTDLFGQDFYLELQDHSLEVEKPILEYLPKFAKEFGLKLICSNDNHYIKQEHSIAHNVMKLIPDANTGGVPLDYKKLVYGTDQIYFKSAEEMQKLFKLFPQAIASTMEVADKCNLELDLKKSHVPKFPLPENAGVKTLGEYLEKLAYDGVRKKYPNFDEAIEARLKHELGTIKRMGYEGYFLIVQDFIAEARRQGVWVGPGRGSAAGSIVSYALDITTIDPLKYDLLFERFLNPDRVSMPDIDIDFTDTKRDLVIKYVKQKYGENAVSQIITFNTLQSKAVLKDVGRVLGIPLSTVEPITKQIPTFQGKVMELKDAYKEIADLKELRKNGDEKMQEWLDISLVLEGMNRNAGMHAAGVVIAPGPIDEYVPMFKSPSTELMTQYSMLDLEKVGLLKMDFLGLKTLRVLENAVKMIKENHNIEIDVENLPEGDEKVFELFSKALTTGIFQFESDGMKDSLRKLKPNAFTDLVAMNALYRPGPMQMIDDFILRKNGKQQIEYLHLKLEPILKETYGIIVYQEQVIRMASDIAGFTLAKADLLRRAMGKKDKELMAKQQKEFIKGAIENGVKEKIAKEIFDLIEKFASYGFNKSHSVAYAMIAYQTAYLKAYYTAEFMAASLSAELDDSDRIALLIADCKKLGCAVLPPDVNESGNDFTIIENGIRFGMSAIKGVGSTAVDSILKARKELGRFTTIFQFIQNVNLRLVNKRTLEALICAGAFDSINKNRAALFASVERLIIFGQSMQEHSSRHQSGLFGGSTKQDEHIKFPPLAEEKKWTHYEQLVKEKSVLGFYVSGHPLEKYEFEVATFSTTNFANTSSVKHESTIRVCGLISQLRKKPDKKGNMMAFMTLEDFYGKCECIVFSKTFEKYSSNIIEDNIVMVIGNADTNGESLKILVNEILPIEQVMTKFAKGISISLDASQAKENSILDLKKILEQFSGTCSCYIDVKGLNGNGAKRYRATKYSVAPSNDLIFQLQNFCGKEAVNILQ